MAIDKKRLGGFKNIYVAPLTGTTYGVPIHIKGAKNIEAELSYESVTFYADNAVDHQDYVFTGGEGTLTITGLTPDEYNLLFGSTVDKGGVLMNAADIAPELALLFERNVVGTPGKVLHVIYACKFAPPGVSAQTMENGLEEELAELAFTVRQLENGNIMHFVNTNTVDVDQIKVDAWYSEVQDPSVVVAGIQAQAQAQATVKK